MHVCFANLRDGVAKPTDEEVEQKFAEWEAEGIEPSLVRIRIVRAAE